MRVLCVSAPMLGHLDWGGYLLTAAELLRGGHDVLWATGYEMRDVLAGQSVPSHILQETGWCWPMKLPRPGADAACAQNVAQDVQRLRMLRSLDQWLDVERVRAATVELIALGKAFRPHLIVSEMFMAAAGIAAEVLDIPFVVAGWPAARSKLTQRSRFVGALAQKRVDVLLAEFGAVGVNWQLDGPAALLSPSLHLTYWSPGWFAGRPLLPQTRMVGGSARPALASVWCRQLSRECPWIFITLGTSFNRDINFFLMAAQAVVQVGGLPILAVGDGEVAAALRGRVPQPSVVVSHVKFAEVLPYCSAAIHHGGAGTTHALVTYGVPQIVVPKAGDQGRQAEGVVRSGVGYCILPKQLTISLLVTALKTILPSTSPVRQNAASLQEEFASLGGISKAAQLLESVV